MARPGAKWPDWRCDSDYAPLLGVERTGFAWEWLRRDAAYRETFRASRGSGARASARAARQWGLHRLEGPDRPAWEARPIWRSDVHTSVLEASADKSSAGDRFDLFDLEELGPFATILGDGSGAEHLLLSDGRRSIRIDMMEGSLRKGPVKLAFRLSGLERLQPRLLALRQLLALRRRGSFSRSLHAPPVQAPRWVMMLRTHDALAAGASQREIAACLLSPEADEPLWRLAAPSLRSRVQRLARSARGMSGGKYLELLS